MSLRSVRAFASLLGLVGVVAMPVSGVVAQPPAAAHASPLDLVKGLREQGMSDLALEYLKDVEKDPSIPAEQKATIPLEKAKCQLEAADDEPDESMRTALVAEATAGFADFLRRSPNHPRAAEAAISLARLKSIEARGELAKAKRIEEPKDDGPAKDEAIKARKAQAAKARPLFVRASDLFKQGADKLDAQLKQGNLDPGVRKTLDQERFDAELARGVNFFALADTYLHPDTGETKERGDNLEKAKAIFGEIAKLPNAGRLGWVARAWMGECEYEQDKASDADKQFGEILKATAQEAEDGKRMVKFFQIQHKHVAAKDTKALVEVQNAARDWLKSYGDNRRARAEANAVRFYLAYDLQREALAANPVPKDWPRAAYKPGGIAEGKLREAERVYRAVAQSDNDYTDRATRNRMLVVRLLLGEAVKPPVEYKTFQEAQMAAIIQIAKLGDDEKAEGKEEDTSARVAAIGGWYATQLGAKEGDIKSRRLKVVALLERARVLAGEKDSPSDVADVLLQLVYFYEMTDQPQEAAILGEHIARHVRTAGGKSSLAGAMALNGYGMASARVPAGPDLEKSRQADRLRAIHLARFIDQKYPNDPSADRARFRLGIMLFEEKDLVGAYDALVKVRPGYDGVVMARLYQGAVASQLLTDPKAGLPEDRRVEVYRRTVEDLEKLTAPNGNAAPELVRSYYTARVRLGLLLFLQSRVDQEAEKAAPGFKRAQDVADELLAQLSGFERLATEKKLNLDGWEAKLLAEDIRVRAGFLRSRLLLEQAADPAGFEAVLAVVGPLLAEMDAQGPYAGQVKEITASTGEDDPAGAQKGRVAALAAGADKVRREVIVVALKTRVRQGDADSGVKLIDLLKKFGGSIEANVGVLEQLSREIGAQIQKLKREKKDAEAKALADGFSKLLARVSAEPNLPTSVQLFIGQSLIAVEDYPGAIAALQKIQPPANPDAIRFDELNRQAASLTAQAAAATDPAEKAKLEAERDTVASRVKAAENEKQTGISYRGATYHLARAQRLAGQFDAADALLKAAIGEKGKEGWAFSSLEFRKEVALLLEARGAAAPANAPAAKENYGKALQEWGVIFSIFRTRVQNNANKPPVGPGGQVNNQLILRDKNAMYDAFYDVQRCLVQANQKLLAGNAANLDKSFTKVAQSCLDVEKIMGDELEAGVWEKYADLMDATPRLKQLYEQAGGKKFLAHPPTQ